MNYVLRISNKLYFQNVKNQILDHFNLKKSLKYANKVKAKIVLIIGDEEFKSSKFSLKNLESGTQVTVNEKELFEKIKNE